MDEGLTGFYVGLSVATLMIIAGKWLRHLGTNSVMDEIARGHLNEIGSVLDEKGEGRDVKLS